MRVSQYRAIFTRAHELQSEIHAAGTDGLRLYQANSNGLAVPSARWHAKNRRYELWGDVVADFLNHALAPAVGEIVGAPVVPTYPWPVEYVERGKIDIHVDQVDNEISLSYSVDDAGDGHEWPLYFMDTNRTLGPGEEGPDVIDVDVWSYENAAKVLLGNNDGVIYRGRDLLHWRGEGRGNDRLRQLVFAWRRVDERACLGSL